MKTKYILLVISVLFLSNSATARVFTWTGAKDTVFADALNWNLAATGLYPGSGDTAIIVSTTNRPVLASSRDVARLVINTGTFDLKGYTFTASGSALFNGGTINNGDLVVRGTKAEFFATTFSVTVDVYSDIIALSGGIFNEICIFTTTGVEDSGGDGGCVFNKAVTIIHSGSSRKFLILAAHHGDEFNENLTVINTSNGPLRIADDDSTEFNGHVELNNMNAGLIYFGYRNGYSELATGKTISVGDSGFFSGELYVKNFTQKGSTTQTLTLTGSSQLFIQKACVFEGNLTLTAPDILCGSSTFNGTTQITKTRTSGNYWSGDNIFNGVTTITYQGTGGGAGDELRLTNTDKNIYNNDVAFESSGNPIQVLIYNGSDFYKNVSNNNAVIFFRKGLAQFKGTNAQALNGSAPYDFDEVIIDKAAEQLTLNSPLNIHESVQFDRGNIISDTINIITFQPYSDANGAHNGSFVSGPVKKVGDTAFEFPVGKNNYRPFGISAPIGYSDAFVIEYFYGEQQFGELLDSTINYISNCNYWIFNRLNGTSEVDVWFSDLENSCEAITADSIYLSRWNGSSWNNLGLFSENDNKLEFPELNSFGIFAFASDANNGQICEQAMEIVVDTIYQHQEFAFSSFIEWFTFTPDSASNLIAINLSIDSLKLRSKLKSVDIYSGISCNNIVLEYSWQFDTLLCHWGLREEISLDSTENYFIKVERYSEFDTCIGCDENPVFLTLSVQAVDNRNNLASQPCNNIIQNSEFNTASCTNNTCPSPTFPLPPNNVINGCTPNWLAGWGSPNVSITSNRFLSMWSQTPQVGQQTGTFGEGAYQTLSTPLLPNKQYIISYDIRTNTTGGPDFFIVSVRSSTLGGLPSSTSCGGGDSYPNSVLGTAIDGLTGITSTFWQNRVFCYSFNTSIIYDQVLLYPLDFLGGNIGWVDIDNFSIYELKYETSDKVICSGGQVIIEPNCIIPNATYSWDNSVSGLNYYNIENPTVNLTNNSSAPITVTYTVTVTYPCQNGNCSIEEEVNVTVLPEPDLIEIENSGCIGENTCFSFTPSNGQIATWSFGDGATQTQSSGNNVCHAYASPGVYLVTLTVTNSDCDFFITNEIQIYPSCCEYPWQYGNIVVNPTGTTETWSTFRSIDGVVRVLPGKTLHLDGMGILFSPKGKIIVERGATLLIESSSLQGVVTGDPPCKNMWQGIEVWGVSTLNHNFANQQYHGRVYISDGSYITDAHNAVVVGKPLGAGYDLLFGGGIIIADDVIFQNNGSNIRFAPFKYTNISKVENSTFESFGNFGFPHLYDPGYTIGSSYTYPNQYNPFYASANIQGRTALGITAWGVKGVLIRDNTFYDVEEGIISIDSRLKIYRNVFTTLQSGIRIANTTSAIQYGNSISENVFNDVVWQINMQGGKADFIGPQGGYGQNEFNPGLGSVNYNVFGILVTGTSGFSIVDNDFNNLKWGFIGWNTLQYGGYVGYRNRGNKFRDCGTAISGIFDNPALRVHCNQFYTIIPGSYDGNSWNFGSGIYADQGSPSLTDPKAPAGNLFDEPSARDVTSASTLNYYRHDESLGNPNVDIDEQQSTMEFINPVGFIAGINADEPCAPEWQNPGQRLLAIDSLNNFRDSLSGVLSEINEHLAEEDTYQLIYEIENNNSDSALMNILRDASPLSDSILHQLNSGTHVLSADSLMELFLLNASFSDEVFNAIILDNTLLDSIGKALLKNRHMQYKQNNTYASVLKHINYTSVNKQQVQNVLMQDYIAEDAFEDAINLIRDSEQFYDKQLLFSYYLSEGILDSALAIFDELEENDQVDADWLFVQEMLLSFEVDSLSVFSIDSTKHSALITIAEKNQGSLATANARAILKLVYNEEYWDDLESIGSSRYMHQHVSQTKPSKKGKDEFLMIKPNPASSYVDIDYLISIGNSNPSKLEILNALGKTMLIKELKSEDRRVRINTNSFGEGIYFISIYNTQTRLNNKFIIIR